jgi:hypothetical protein
MLITATGVQEHLKAWLADPQARDQYVIYRGDDLAVNWHGKASQCEEAHKRAVSRLTDYDMGLF